MITLFGAGFLMGWVGSMPLAGAVSIFVFHRGLAGRYRRGLVLAAGAALAESIWCLVAVIGAGRVLSRWPGFAGIAKAIGGVILLALGLYFLAKKSTLPAGAADGAGDADPPPPFRREFMLGFALVAGNVSIPFTWLGMITVAVSWGLRPVAGDPWLFVAGVALGIMGWFALLLRILTAFRASFRPRTHEILMTVMGALLMVAGALTLLRARF